MSKEISLTPTIDMVKEMGKVWPATAGDSLHPNSLDDYTKTTIEWCRQELILVQLVEMNKKFDKLLSIIPTETAINEPTDNTKENIDKPDTDQIASEQIKSKQRSKQTPTATVPKPKPIKKG